MIKILKRFFERRKEPKVIDVSRRSYDICITFDNGIMAYFYGYYKGIGYDCEGLEKVTMKKDEIILFDYVGRYSYTPEENNRVVYVAENFTKDDAVALWSIAMEYLTKAFHNNFNNDYSLHFAWKLVCAFGLGHYKQLKEEAAVLDQD